VGIKGILKGSTKEEVKEGMEVMYIVTEVVKRRWEG